MENGGPGQSYVRSVCHSYRYALGSVDNEATRAVRQAAGRRRRPGCGRERVGGPKQICCAFGIWFGLPLSLVSGLIVSVTTLLGSTVAKVSYVLRSLDVYPEHVSPAPPLVLTDLRRHE